MHTCAYACTHIHINTHKHIHTCRHKHIIHLSKHTNMFMYIHTYEYTIRHIYLHTHILKQSELSTLLSIYSIKESILD